MLGRRRFSLRPYKDKVTDPNTSAPVTTTAVREPVEYLPSDVGKGPEEGIALCLSGGGYRAMLFHTGVLWRLNDMGLLRNLKRISSVSGGTIAAAALAKNWACLNFEGEAALNFEEAVVDPIRELAKHTIDIPSIIAGKLWFGSVGNKLAKRYRRHLFGDATLQDIPDAPRFVFNATNVQSGVLFRFSKPYARDYRVGEVKNPTIDLATVVAASSAFPPFLSPISLYFDPSQFTPNSGTDLQTDDYRREVVLTDGGVYDNLGLETAWKRYKTILVSDAGGGYSPQRAPWKNWTCHSYRVLMTIDNQVRALRKRQVVGSFVDQIRTGAYWSIASDRQRDLSAMSPLHCPLDCTTRLAGLSTRLRKLDATTQMKLINWGYVLTDVSVRKYVAPGAGAAGTFPLPDAGV